MLLLSSGLGPPTRPLLPVKAKGRSGAPPGGGTLPLQSASVQFSSVQLSSVQFSSVQVSCSVVSDSASAYKQENRKATGKPPPRRITAKWPIRLLLGTETGWCGQKLGGTKSVVTGSNLNSSLSLFVIKLLAGNCCWITFCTVLLNSDSCCHLPFLSVLFSLFITSSLLLGCEPRGQPECLHLGVAQSS